MTQRTHWKYYQESEELTGNTIKRVTNVRTICDVLNGNPVVKQMCPDLHLLLKLYLTFPLRTATAEQTFPTTRRLKTYLRSSMSQGKIKSYSYTCTFLSQV